MSKPIIYIDMEGTILATLPIIDYYDMLDEPRTHEIAKYITEHGVFDYDRVLVTRPDIRKLLNRLRKIGSLVLFSGAALSEICMNLHLLGLSKYFTAVHSTHDTNDMIRPFNKQYVLIDDSHNIVKLELIDPAYQEDRLIMVSPYYGVHRDTDAELIYNLVVDALAIKAQ